MSVNVQASLDQHGLTADEQMAVFAYMNRSQQVNAYEVKQHIAVSFECGFCASFARAGGGARGSRARAGAGSMARVDDSRIADADADVATDLAVGFSTLETERDD